MLYGCTTWVSFGYALAFQKVRYAWHLRPARTENYDILAQGVRCECSAYGRYGMHSALVQHVRWEFDTHGKWIENMRKVHGRNTQAGYMV